MDIAVLDICLWFVPDGLCMRVLGRRVACRGWRTAEHCHVCRFAPRHNALSPQDEKEMCEIIGAKDMDDLMNSSIPDGLPRLDGLNLGVYTKGMSETEFLEHFKYDSLVLYLRPCVPILPGLRIHTSSRTHAPPITLTWGTD